MSNLSSGIILAILGFILTTVAGGLLGSFLQTRLWKHQWTVQYRSKKQDEARAVFEEVSRLMDRRLFRLSQLAIWISRQDEDRTNISLSDYRDVIKEWNDSINRTISLLEFYFGRELRNRFDNVVGGDFVKLGSRVEKLYRTRAKPDDSTNQSVARSIGKLRGLVYDYNLSMLRCLDEMAASAEPKSFLHFTTSPMFVVDVAPRSPTESDLPDGVSREPSRVDR